MENSIDLDEEPIELPPGFRFHPTDEELITHYLTPKLADSRFSSRAVGEVDLNKVEPWDLPWKAKMGEKEWYFFFIRDRKYPTGSRTNRATGAGYWKATGKDREIFRDGILVGMKKTLVFYRGRAPTGEKMDWVMHEYRSEGRHAVCKNLQSRPGKEEWVLCRVFKKSSGGTKVHISGIVSGSNLPDQDRVRTRACPEGTCLSLEDDPGKKLFDGFTSRNCTTTSQFPLVFPAEEDSAYSSNHSGCVLMQDNLVGMSKAEFLQDMSCNRMGMKPYYADADHQEFPIVCSDPVDLDCLWNY